MLKLKMIMMFFPGVIRPFFVAMLMVVALKSFSQNAVDIKVDLVSANVWRGILNSPAPNVQPTLTFTAANEHFFAGAWGSTGLGRYYGEIDLFAGFSFGALSVSVWDYFIMPDSEDFNYFNYRKQETRHELEFLIELEAPANLPLTFLWGTFFHGDVRNEDGNPMYSSYFEVKYNFLLAQNAISVFAGITPWESYYADQFSLINVPLTASKNLSINEHFEIPLSARLILNPYEKKTWFVFAVSF